MPKVKQTKPKSNKAKESGRAVIYAEVVTKICQGDDALTAEQAKSLLGWTEETEEIKFGNDYLLVDRYEQKIRCYNDLNNRPFMMPVCIALMSEILNGNWQLNCENRIIGKTGLILNGQHTLVALILAVQEWEKHGGSKRDNKYHEYWKTEPTIDTLIAFGADESDRVVNTMDTCKPRTLEEVIYRSSYYANRPEGFRRKASKILSHAIKMLWHRTGAGLDAFSPKRTHAESLDFVARHGRILECVAHILEENGDDNRIAKYLSLGYASAFMYLMASASTDRENEDGTGYSQMNHPSEKQLNFDKWDLASEFWVKLAAASEELDEVRIAMAKAIEDGLVGVNVRCALIAKAWLVMSDGDEVTSDDLELVIVKNDEGYKVLAECPTVGGIDLGNPA